MKNRKIFLFFHLNLITLCALGMDKTFARMQYAHAVAHANAAAGVIAASRADVKVGGEVGGGASKPVSLNAAAAIDHKIVGERLLNPQQKRVVDRFTAELHAKFSTRGKRELAGIHRAIFPISLSSIQNEPDIHEGVLLGLHHPGINSVDLDNNCTRAVTTDNSGGVKIWDLKTGSELSSVNVPHCFGSKSIFNHDGTEGLTLSLNSNLDELQRVGFAIVWALEKNKPKAYENLASHTIVWNAAFNHDGTRVLLVESDGIHVYQKTDNTFRKICSGQDIDDAVFNHDGSKIFVASDKTIHIVDVQSQQVSELELENSFWYKGPHRVVCNHDSTQLIFISEKSVKILDAQTGKEVDGFGHLSNVESAAFNHDGTQMVTFAREAAYIWDLKTQTCIVKFEPVSKQPALSRDGNQILFAIEDYALLWDLTEINRFNKGDIPADQIMFLWQLNQKKAGGEKTITLDADELIELSTLPRVIQRAVVRKFGVSNPPEGLMNPQQTSSDAKKQAEKGATK